MPLTPKRVDRDAGPSAPRVLAQRAGLGRPTRSQQGSLYSRGDAAQFIRMAAQVGRDTARAVMATPNVSARRELLAAALAERVPALPAR